MWIKSGEKVVNTEKLVGFEVFAYNAGDAELRAYLNAAAADGQPAYLLLLQGSAALVSRALEAILGNLALDVKAFDLDLWQKNKARLLQETQVGPVEEVRS